MADLVLDVDWDISKAEAKQRKLNREFDESQKKAGLIKDKIEDLNSALDDERAKQKEIKDVYKEQEAELRKLSAQLDRVKSGKGSYQDYKDIGSIEDAESKLSEMQSAIEKTNAAYDESIAKSEKIESEIAKQNLELDKQNNKTASIGDKIVLNSKKQKKSSEAFKKSSAAVGQLSKRVGNLISSALFFSVLTKAFTALRQEFSKLITEEGSKTAALVAKLNGSLSIIGRMLYETFRPAIEWTLQALTTMVNILTYGLSMILGKNVNDMKKLVQQTKKAGKEAQKTTASFDTIQTLSSSNESSGGTKADYSSLGSGVDSTIGAIMTLVIGASLLAVGVILIGFGMIPVGIAAMVAGLTAMGIAGVTISDTISPKVKAIMTAILAIVGVALIVIGIILICTGVGIPVAIALIAAGAASLVTAAAINWNFISDKIKGVIELFKTSAIFGAGMVLMGLLLMCTGVGFPLGIQLLYLGIASLGYQAAAPNWNLIVDKIKGIWNEVRKVWDEQIKPQTIAKLIGLWTEAKKVWDEQIKPGIDKVILAWNELYSKHLAPIIGKLKDMLLVPFMKYLSGLFTSEFMSVIGFIVDVVKVGIDLIGGYFSGFCDIISGIITFIDGAFSGDWEKAWSGVSSILTGVVNMWITTFEGGINLIISGLNLLLGGFNGVVSGLRKLEIPGMSDILTDVSLEIPKVEIPRLARGAVIPGGREFAAILGDQPKGQTNIEAPAELIKQMAVEALLEVGLTGQPTKEEHYYLGETELMSILYKLVKGGERLRGDSLVRGGVY